MNSRTKLVTASLWLFLPLVAFRKLGRCGIVCQFESQFTSIIARARTNGWMSREGSLQFILIFMAAISRLGHVSHVAYPHAALIKRGQFLGVFYVVLGALYCGEESISCL